MEVRTVAKDQEVNENIKEQRGNETEDFNRRQEKKAGCKDSEKEACCASVVCGRTDRKSDFVAWVCALTLFLEWIWSGTQYFCPSLFYL